MCQIIPAIQISTQEAVQGIEAVLENRAIGAGTVTRDGLQDVLSTAITDMLQQHGVIDFINNQNIQTNLTPQHNEGPAEFNPSDNTTHFWGGRFHLVPENFEFPSVGPRLAFQYWCNGDSRLLYPPLRLLQPIDMQTSNLKKRLCDFKYLMNKILGLLRDRDAWIANPTIIQVDEMYNLIEEDLGMQMNTPTNRQRRVGQMGWRNAVKILRATERANRVDN